jgi:exodeoxyribonuclease VII large subunit
MLETRCQRVDGLAHRLVHPAAHLAQHRRDAAALSARLARACRGQLASSRSRIESAGARIAWLVRQPLPQNARVAIQRDLMRRAAAATMERARTRVAAAAQSLAHLNPQAVLERGYAIVTTADGSIVDDASRLNVGDDVALAFARGTAGAKVNRRDAG